MTDKKGITVLVTGGRDYSDNKEVNKVLDKIHQTDGIKLLIHWAARGADFLADVWGLKNKIKIKRYQADWKKHGKAAGPIRNELMLTDNKDIDLIVAFPGGKGTDNMIKLALTRKLKIKRILSKPKKG
jgi:hypothetical protein